METLKSQEREETTKEQKTWAVGSGEGGLRSRAKEELWALKRLLFPLWSKLGRDHARSITDIIHAAWGKVDFNPNSQSHEDRKLWDFKMLKDACPWRLSVWGCWSPISQQNNYVYWLADNIFEESSNFEFIPPVIPLRQKNPRLSVLLLLFMVIKTQPTDSNKHAEWNEVKWTSLKCTVY